MREGRANAPSASPGIKIRGEDRKKAAGGEGQAEAGSGKAQVGAKEFAFRGFS